MVGRHAAVAQRHACHKPRVLCRPRARACGIHRADVGAAVRPAPRGGWAQVQHGQLRDKLQRTRLAQAASGRIPARAFQDQPLRSRRIRPSMHVSSRCTCLLACTVWQAMMHMLQISQAT